MKQYRSCFRRDYLFHQFVVVYIVHNIIRADISSARLMKKVSVLLEVLNTGFEDLKILLTVDINGNAFADTL